MIGLILLTNSMTKFLCKYGVMPLIALTYQHRNSKLRPLSNIYKGLSNPPNSPNALIVLNKKSDKNLRLGNA